MANTYDVIIVGARCAGAPTAMLLARKGYKVLVVDRATFPSDTISTHLIHPPGMASLERWGLSDAVAATNCPPIDTYDFNFGPMRITGSPCGKGQPASRSPRRTVLDTLLIDAARRAGAEVREGFTVDEIVSDNGRVVGIRGHERGGRDVTERARVVIGADGRHSMVAEAVGAEEYNQKPELLAAYYSYWSNWPLDHFVTYVLPYESCAAWPTNDGLTMVIAGWQYKHFDAYKKDVEGNYRRVIDLVPELGASMRDAKREEKLYGSPVRGYFRKPYGPGWALVGDAGYNKDFVTAQGIQDAFRDAEACVTALDDALTGTRTFEAAMADYQSARDRHVGALYEYTADIASQEPPPEQAQQLLAAVSRNPEAMNEYVQVYAGVISPEQFFAEENVQKIFAGAA